MPNVVKFASLAPAAVFFSPLLSLLRWCIRLQYMLSSLLCGSLVMLLFLFLNYALKSHCLQYISRDLGGWECVWLFFCFIFASIGSFHVQNIFGANSISATILHANNRVETSPFLYDLIENAFLVVLNVRDYNVYELLCAFTCIAYICICNHAYAKYWSHFWYGLSICFCRPNPFAFAEIAHAIFRTYR